MATKEQPLVSEPILRGRLEDLDVSDLLSALKLGRQYLTLEVYDAAGECTGVVAVKAGRIISASVDGYTGAEAVRRFLQRRESAEFRVVLQPMAASLPAEPLAADTELTHASSESGVRPLDPRTRVMEGVLSEQLRFDDVLRGLAFTRQNLTLALSDAAGDALGEVALKANKVLSARAGELLGLRALRQLQLAPVGSRFVLFAEAHSVTQLHPLGSVEELLCRVEDAGEAREKPASSGNGLSHTERTQHTQRSDLGADAIAVMDGQLGELDLASILHVVGASRQYTCVHIFDDERTPLGSIHLKGGHVVRAQAQDVTGVLAVRRLLHCPRDFSFLVQRYPHAPEVTASIGSIASVLARAAAEPAPISTSVTSSPAPTPRASGAPVRHVAASNTWIGGAAVGAGFVLLGGIASALVLRSPALNTNTSVSPISVAPQVVTPKPAEITPPPAAPLEAAPAPVEPAIQPIQPDTSNEQPLVPSDFTEPPSRATIASLQAGLHQLGYDTGPIDGTLGPRTAAAIRAFQYAEHLTVDGTLTGPTRAVLLRRISEP